MTTDSSRDYIQRFLFDQVPVRGLRVLLHKSYQESHELHHHPETVRNQLGQFAAAACLLSSTLKFDGELSLQARSEGEIPLIMAEATSKRTFRCIAHNANQAIHSEFKQLFLNGNLAITLSPAEGNRYQGVVAMDEDNLSRCLEGYFERSEQLKTRIWLFSNGEMAAGFLLQQLPSAPATTDSEEFWEHICHLSETVTPEELFTLDSQELLHRLFDEETIRLFEPENLNFACSCSRQRYTAALISLGQEELNQIFAEQGEIVATCEFCNQKYVFQPHDLGEQDGNHHITRH